jgi:hypothetical protein
MSKAYQKPKPQRSTEEKNLKKQERRAVGSCVSPEREETMQSGGLEIRGPKVCREPRVWV